MSDCVLHLGSNIGFKAINLELARVMISNHIGPIVESSQLYETEAWGNLEQDSFINQALTISTDLSAESVLKQIHQIESKMGRRRDEKWGPRIIDIDIIFYNNEIIENHHLKIPHPQLTNRNFVLIPLLEICPDKEHPTLNKTISTLARECKDKSSVRKLGQ